MRNSTAVYLTIIGGVFYVLGGVLVVSLAGSLSSLGGLSGLDGIPYTSVPSLGSGGLNDLIYVVGGFGIVAGILIIFGGYLMKSEKPNRRKMGSILALVMVLLGSLSTLGGLVIGFILAGIGVYMGLTYKASRSNLVVPIGPMASVTLGPQTIPQPATDGSSSAGRGPLNYCIKCGSRLRDGAVFCGACGARVPE